MTLQGGRGFDNVSHIPFFAFRNTDFKTFASEKFCLTARLGFFIIHLALQSKLGLKHQRSKIRKMSHGAGGGGGEGRRSSKKVSRII